MVEPAGLVIVVLKGETPVALDGNTTRKGRQRNDERFSLCPNLVEEVVPTQPLNLLCRGLDEGADKLAEVPTGCCGFLLQDP